jgi:hypothetical protein
MSKPGVCDICGCAVVRMNIEAHYNKKNADGHIYINGKLIRVRCSKHTKTPDSEPECDAHGGSRRRDSSFWFW